MGNEKMVQEVGKKPARRLLWTVFIIAGTLALLGALTGAAAAAMVANNEYHVNLSLKGSQEIYLECGASYKDPGAEGVGYGTLLMTEPRQLEITVSGDVDTTVIGRYEIVYTAAWEGVTKTVKRVVHVIDSKKPTIELVADPEHYTIPGNPYEEEGFTAYDAYDGDLTDQVVRTEKDGTVTYTVADSSGNTTQVTRTIRYHDPIAPEVQLQGDAEITLYVGSTFEDPGALAVDNCEGDLSDRVEITGSLDCAAPGSYTLTYTVRDSYGNEASVSRTVHIIPVPAPVIPDPVIPDPVVPDPVIPNPVGGVIYLTFDDGPSSYTAELLDVLDKYNVKATFFVCANGRLDLLPEIVERGHSIGLHSVTHVYEEIYASEEAYFRDLYGIQDVVRQYTGVTTYLMRFPGGSSTTTSRFNPGIMTRLTQQVQEKGFRYFDWNVSSGDASGAHTADEVYWNVISGAASKSCSVVLQHDWADYSVAAVERIIQWGLENGYTFAALGMDSDGCHHLVSN